MTALVSEWGVPRADDDPYWAAQGKAWVEIEPGRKRLIDLNRPYSPPKRSHLSAPYIRRDSIEPCWGADGKMHESLSSYRRSLRAENNPQGENYIELGNESLPTIERTFDRKARREDIKAAIADVKAGKPIPAPVVLED